MEKQEQVVDDGGLQPVVVLPAPADHSRGRVAKRRQEHRRRSRSLRRGRQGRGRRGAPIVPVRPVRRPPAQPRPPTITQESLSTRPTAPAACVLPPRSCPCDRQGGPGPGSYDAHKVIPFSTRSSPRIVRPFKEGTEPAFLRRLVNTPGPAAYSPHGGIGARTESLPQRGATIASRLRPIGTESERHVQPGPADYAVTADVGSRGHAGASGFSFGSRPALKAEFKQTRFWTPGPGAYTPQPPPRGPCATLLGRTKELRDSDGPGPGAYNEPREMSKQKTGVTLKGRTYFAIPNKGQGPPPTNYDTRPPLPSPPRMLRSAKVPQTASA
eukprot:TRINITY_DN24352_c0_g1_i1.p1 TRINITY_DN24352_c0_g1~~TRINITY_DN24352_c0_g1_i1.p1  ORF type:complete len:327 (+),score=45.60 TRINITY_DN24352_c0_g1_i1:58-1038(+)